MSKPHAIISLAFSCAKRLVSLGVRSFHKNFSSSVIWMTSGTLNTSCSHLYIHRHLNRSSFFFSNPTLSWWMVQDVPSALLRMMDHDQYTSRTVSFVHMHLIYSPDLWKWSVRWNIKWEKYYRCEKKMRRRIKWCRGRWIRVCIFCNNSSVKWAEPNRTRFSRERERQSNRLKKKINDVILSILYDLPSFLVTKDKKRR